MNRFIKPKIALVHDNIRYVGGAERVLLAFHDIWKDAPIYTSTISWGNLGDLTDNIRVLKVIVSWAQKIPFFAGYPFLYRYFLLLIWKSFDFSKFDIVISSSGAQMSHLIKIAPGSMHICYCHTPPRHLYGYMTDFNWQKDTFIRSVANLLNRYLRRYDFQAAQRVTYFIANSKEVARRIKEYYGRDSVIIPPPCSFKLLSVNKSDNKGRKEDYFLVVSRLSRMKHIDLIIKAFNLINLPLIIVGIGPEENNLKKIAGKNIQFMGLINDKKLSDLYQTSKAVVCGAEDEDFGIVPIEAMGFGKPVIAYYSGGYKETVVEGKTGFFFKTLSTSAIIKALNKFSKMDFKSIDCINQAKKYSLRNFQKQIESFVEEKYNEYSLSEP